MEPIARTSHSELRAEVAGRPGETERLAAIRAQTLEEIRLGSAAAIDDERYRVPIRVATGEEPTA